MQLISKLPKLAASIALGVSVALLSACGGGSDSGEYNYNNSSLSGEFGGTTRLNGFDVISEISVKPNGDFLGLAFNNLENNQPDTVFTILKGNINGSRLYEFDLIGQDINRYNVDSRPSSSRNNIYLEFDSIPSYLTRPRTLTVSRIETDSINLTDLIGTFESTTLDLTERTASSMDFRRVSSSRLALTYSDTNGCTLDATVVKKFNQLDYLVLENARFSGYYCRYDNESFEGMLGYDYPSDSVVLIGVNQNNSNAMVVASTPRI